MNATRTIHQDMTDQPPSSIPVLEGDAVESWQPDHPYLEPLCVPPLCQLIMADRSFDQLMSFTHSPNRSISGEIEVES